MAIKIEQRLKVCHRCGSLAKERHHKRPRSEGGSDKEENLVFLCTACHDYIHSKRKILQQLNLLRNKKPPKRAKTIGQVKEWKLRNAKRIQLWEHRLAVLELLNTEEIIKSTGKYTSYWVDMSTH